MTTRPPKTEETDYLGDGRFFFGYTAMLEIRYYPVL